MPRLVVRYGYACLLTLLLSLAPVSIARSQSTEFSLSVGSVSFPTPTLANYSSWPSSATGPVTDSVPVQFVVDRVNQSTVRITTVLIRCAGTTGVKTCADIEWRSNTNQLWRPLSLIDAEVEARTVIPLQSNDPWSGVVWLRVRLNMSDPAPSISTSNVALTMSVYRP